MDSYALPADPRDAFSQAGYLAARLLTQTLQALPPEALTRERVTAALRATQTFDSDMLCRNFYIGDGPRHNANHGGPVLTMVGKGYAMVSMGCLLAQDPELDDVLERERKRPAGPLRTLR
jgi:branched-chain amino acid transport system substrate-binding protein